MHLRPLLKYRQRSHNKVNLVYHISDLLETMRTIAFTGSFSEPAHKIITLIDKPSQKHSDLSISLLNNKIKLLK